MKWSQTFLFTFKDAPADAEIVSHQLFMRGGIIKKVAPGIFTYTVIGLRAIRKLENIIREELAKISCQEVLMPMVQPRSLWDESGRWPFMGELLKFKNKNDQDFCLGATHEEVICDYVRGDLKSYRDLPASLYQIQTKYRDEIRPRFGLMRGREFIMKDAYTFDETKEQAMVSYEKMKTAYNNIFKRIGFDFRAVEADTGAIGGNLSHEFQVLSESGMDKLLTCEKCEYASNEEITPVVTNSVAGEAAQAMEKFATPDAKTIVDLAAFLNKAGIKTNEADLVKTFFVKFTKNNKPKFYALLVPGDREVNLIKVKKVVDQSVDAEMCNEAEVLEITKAHPGSCGPVGLKTAAIVMDSALKNKTNMIVGANEDGFHFKNVNPGRDFNVHFNGDISLARAGDKCPNCNGNLKAVKGSEVGHIFYLGKKYADPMKVQFLNRAGKSETVEMGCYGIGVTRTVQSAIEQAHDNDGMIWPAAISPFLVHFCLLDNDEGLVNAMSSMTSALDKKGFDYFIDDRDERPGVKFKDADLLGFPVRVVLGKKAFEAGQIEFTFRKTKEQHKINIAEAPEFLAKHCSELLKR